MPNFNKNVELRRVHGLPIPKNANKCAKGSKHGLYFFWRGNWFFTVIPGYYIDVHGDNEAQERCVHSSIGNNKIENLGKI